MTLDALSPSPSFESSRDTHAHVHVHALACMKRSAPMRPTATTTRISTSPFGRNRSASVSVCHHADAADARQSSASSSWSPFTYPNDDPNHDPNHNHVDILDHDHILHRDTSIPHPHTHTHTHAQPSSSHRRTRKLKILTTTLEILFCLWAIYSTARYFLAFGTATTVTGTVMGTVTTTRGVRTCALVLGIVSALAGALVILSLMMPLFPSPPPVGPTRDHFRLEQHQEHTRHPHRAHTLLLLRITGPFLLLLLPSLTNLALVLALHPDKTRCAWDVDVLWASPTTGADAGAGISYAGWLGTSTARVLVSLGLMVSFQVTWGVDSSFGFFSFLG
ncbi:hypothetical protein F5I97DRAFT_397615 [Phlebopus sp. FC_14]|nr:hypothetical protein F5I97DRAFT_397615 [Phlebopus sp. FC_14]